MPEDIYSLLDALVETESRIKKIMREGNADFQTALLIALAEERAL